MEFRENERGDSWWELKTKWVLRIEVQNPPISNSCSNPLSLSTSMASLQALPLNIRFSSLSIFFFPFSSLFPWLPFFLSELPVSIISKFSLLPHIFSYIYNYAFQFRRYIIYILDESWNLSAIHKSQRIFLRLIFLN